MKTVASEVPPTGTFSIGTGNASTKVEATSNAASPASSPAEGSDAAKDDAASTTATVAVKTTGTMTGSKRLISRENRSVGFAWSERVSPRVTSVAVDPNPRPLPRPGGAPGRVSPAPQLSSSN